MTAAGRVQKTIPILEIEVLTGARFAPKPALF
jgi:hypothetical protein